MPHNPERTPAEHDAALRFLKFFAAHDADWARTGHMPALAAVIDSPECRELPHRAALAEIAHTATPHPKQIRRSEENTYAHKPPLPISYAVLYLNTHNHPHPTQ